MITDFVYHATAKQAQLQLVHVLALRLYTSSSFQSLNLPLRHAGAGVWEWWHVLCAVCVCYAVCSVHKLCVV